ncbi:MAG: bacterial transcriptional activator domain-containing protein, partial [Thermomicrobiales bacterium]|nr:bacterial transcriptional activator domain-containing protein [Thermomicrobiales bacterium]
DPLRETAEHRLIKCLADAGRRIEALQQYELFCQILQRELSMTPPPETEALARRIRLDPAD